MLLIALILALAPPETAAPLTPPAPATPKAEAAFAARRAERIALLPPAPPVPSITTPTNNAIDAFIADAWAADDLREAKSPPPLCDDSTFLRRVYLDLIGVIPTLAERDRFLSDAAADKRARLIDELLARKADYADHWTPFWEDALVSATVGTTGGMASHGNYTPFIREAFLTNRPFDLFVAELLDPSLPRYRKPEVGSDNGRPVKVHYVLNERHTDTLQTAAGVAQVFMGTAMKCASCHNHFENEEWPQDRFTAFAGLFSPKDLEVIRCEKRSGRTVPAAFPFEVLNAPTDIPATEPARLARAAQLLTDPLNPRFARTIVNRLWKRYLGTGLFEPADDYRLDWPPSHPALLDWLADDLIRHNFDIQRTTRLILTSRTYQTRFNPAVVDHFDIAEPTAARYFCSPSLRRLTAEQLVDSINVALTQNLDPARRLFRKPETTALSLALAKPAIRNDESTARSSETSILQGLELLNGAEYAAIVKSGPLVTQPLPQPEPPPAPPTNQELATRIFQAILSRDPTPAELAVLVDFLSTCKSRDAAIHDALWALFTSPEFAYIK